MHVGLANMAWPTWVFIAENFTVCYALDGKIALFRLYCWKVIFVAFTVKDPFYIHMSVIFESF